MFVKRLLGLDGMNRVLLVHNRMKSLFVVNSFRKGITCNRKEGAVL